MEVLVRNGQLPRLGVDEIERRLAGCPRLPSLGSVYEDLRALLEAENCTTFQVADVIRRDPGLTTRLLRLINSVYYDLSTPSGSIDVAVFFIGVCQIRRLAVATPIIEHLEQLTGKSQFPWPEFWRHCVATAIATSEILDDQRVIADDSDYVAALLHDVGKIVTAAVFPEYFERIRAGLQEEGADPLQVEAATLGIDHCELGARYLADQKLPESTIEVVRFHHRPKQAPNNARLVAAVQVADLFVRHARIGNSGNPVPVSAEDWKKAEGWDLLFPDGTEERALAQANIKKSLERLSATVKGPV